MAYTYKIDSSEELKQGGFDFPIKDDEYHYIKIGATNVEQLKKAGILPNKKYTGLEKNKPDGLILYGKNDIKVLVEYKKKGIFQSKKEARNIINDWYFELAKKVNCNVICASDGTHTYWFYVPTGEVIKNKDDTFLNLKLDVSKITNGNLTTEEKNELYTVLTKFNHLDDSGTLKDEIVLNPQDLARRVWQKIWINTGKEPEKCLYNVVEIFIFKFLSDLNILEDSLSFNHVLGLKKESHGRVLEVYSNDVRKKIREMFPVGSDGTTIINGTIFVNEDGEPNHKNAKLFVEVLEEFKIFEKENGTFDNIDKNFKTRLYENFLRQQAGIRSLGQYFTPRNVVKSVIGMIGTESIHENAKICDPFCGVGGFLLELLNETPKLKKQFEPVNGEINPKVEIIGYDKGSDEKEDERTIILAKANMLIYFADYIAKYKNAIKEFSEKVFNKTFHLLKTNVGTLGKEEHKDYFDLIITNPPYVTSGVSSIKNDLDMKLYPSNGNGVEGLAIEWIIRALKPNGKAFIVVPDGVLSRLSDKTLREKIKNTCDVNAIISLPSRTFFATPKKTFILTLTKKGNDISQKTPIFTYLVTNIGETKDAKRFEIENNDLKEMVTLYRQFNATPQDFKTDKPRCKIQAIDRLNNNHWLVDRDWSDDEKKELGLQDDTTEFTENEFDKLLGEIGNFITDFTHNEI